MTQRRLKHFGWGCEGDGLTSAEKAFVLVRIEQQLGPLANGDVKPPRLEDLKLESPRLNPPASLPFCSTGFMTERHMPTANHSLTMCAGLSVITATRQTSLPIHALRRRSRQCSTGQAPRRLV